MTPCENWSRNTVLFLAATMVLLLGLPLCFLHRHRWAPPHVHSSRPPAPAPPRQKPDRSGLLAVFRHTGPAQVRFSPDGRLSATALPDGDIRISDDRTGHTLCLIHAHAKPVSADDADGDIRPGEFSPDQRYFITCTDRAEVWDAHTGKRHGVIKPYAGYIGDTAFSRSGDVLALGMENATVQTWDLNTLRRTHNFAGPGLPVRLVHFCPDGHLVAVGSNHHRMTLWRCQIRH